ncbi:uncharacterized protein CTRU02_213984 [Colletotrichum truncatum]|uniref:Uncharacterized protein n=1 Tax=Colletotrichum truncatum TaxID=5467 RepID=A0ACC3YH70_COLTU|nr:uncharacterized protein CTRU02_06297 [Colletotrichum truncatum]KAF6792801.1 hypothetical protein CTRU02_06297 [Colletotrichum truncatum]
MMAFTVPAVVVLCLSTLTQCNPVDLHPSEEVARSRGPQIFNAVHDSMKQWGSSLHHNGMSIFLATVPEGVLLYHGNTSPESPSEPDWLAYEIEHAEQFAHSFSRRPPKGPPGGPPGGPPKEPPGEPPQGPPGHPDAGFFDTNGRQHVLGSRAEKRAEGARGWLHVYRATEPLQLLYVDGMSGGKTTMGTLDTQDYLLRSVRSDPWAEKEPPKALGGGPMGERERAVDLCKLSTSWGLHGILRMEAGFEIIMCDFEKGLEQVQALRRPEPSRQNERRGEVRGLETLRGFAERYQGIGASRTLVDYSSMVSAFFFPVNLTNPDEKRPDLPRLSEVSDSELASIKDYLHETIQSRLGAQTSPVNWQGIADLIVGRYSDRIEFMASRSSSPTLLADEVSFLLDVYIHYPDDGGKPDLPEAISRCSEFYLQIMNPSTEADRLIHAAFQTVTSRICSTLFDIRERVSGVAEVSRSDLEWSAEALQSLISFLGWSRFKRCESCDLDAVCFIPMWPMGSQDDYYSPNCKNGSDLRGGNSYWKM